MGIRSYIKNTVKDNSNVKSWSSWDAIKDNARVIGTLARGIQETLPNQSKGPVATLTFEQAVAKYNLSAADLQKRMRRHFLVSVLCAILAIGAFGWTIFIFSKGMFLSGLVALSLTLLMLTFAFQESFRRFLIKQKRLDCTVSEWFADLFSKTRGGKS